MNTKPCLFELFVAVTLATSTVNAGRIVAAAMEIVPASRPARGGVSRAFVGGNRFAAAEIESAIEWSGFSDTVFANIHNIGAGQHWS